MTEPWTTARVLAAAGAAIWVPPEAPQVVTDDYLLVDFPPGFDDEQPTQVQWTRSDRPAADLVAEVVDRTRAWQRSRLGWWIRLDHRPPDLPDHLRSLGATTVETVGVLAREIETSLPDAPSSSGADVRVEVVRDERTLRDARLVYAEVWGRSPDPTAEELARDLAEAATPLGERPMFQVVAYLDDEPASAGGLHPLRRGGPALGSGHPSPPAGPRRLPGHGPSPPGGGSHARRHARPGPGSAAHVRAGAHPPRLRVVRRGTAAGPRGVTG